MGTEILDRMDLASQEMLAMAQRHARALGHGRTTPVHLLWAALQTRHGRQVLERAGTDTGLLRRRVEAWLGELPSRPGADTRLGERIRTLLEGLSSDSGRETVGPVAPGDLLSALARLEVGAAGEMLLAAGFRADRLTGHEGTPDAPWKVLDQYARDLTAEAEAGLLGPCVGRQDILRRLVRILVRRHRNNPLLVGPPGVGRRTIVCGLCDQIAHGQAPRALTGLRVLQVDTGAILAGAKYRGEFEERFRTFLQAVEDAPFPVLLFFPDVHQIVGAGASSSGGMDAASLLKPAMARGRLRCLGTTTPEAFRLTMDRDPELSRLFQPIEVPEPDRVETVAILKGVRPALERHHGISISDGAIDAAERLARRYVQGRMLPDKAVDLLDEAAGRLRVELDGIPDELADVDERLLRLKLELEATTEPQSRQRLQEELRRLDTSRQAMVAQWQRELELLERLRAVRRDLAEAERLAAEAMADGDVRAAEELREKRINRLREEQESLEGELAAPDLQPRLLSDLVTEKDVADVVATWTGIPVSDMLASERERLMAMEQYLQARVKGQEEAIRLVSAAIRRARVGLKAPNRPVGSFLFLGPTGVGKTELAKALSAFLFQDERAMVRFDMSEFMDKAAVSRLVGAPPGYVGYEAGGQLTEAIRRRPYSLVLFDEVEKAHEEVFDVLLQVLDDGRLTDSFGRTVDMSNTVLVLTSNIGASRILQLAGDKEAIQEAVREELLEHFRPEFLNRLDEIVVFNPLGKDQLEEIADLLLGQVRSLLAERHWKFDYTEALKEAMVDLGYDPAFGARPLRRAIQRHVLDPVAMELLEHTPAPSALIRVDWRDGELKVEIQEPDRLDEAAQTRESDAPGEQDAGPRIEDSQDNPS